MASQGGDSDLLETLYPVPLSTGITPFPGHSSESARALLGVLKHNYQTHHNFFNALGYHKYVPSSITSLYTAALNLAVMPRIMYSPFIPSVPHLRS